MKKIASKFNKITLIYKNDMFFMMIVFICDKWFFYFVISRQIIILNIWMFLRKQASIVIFSLDSFDDFDDFYLFSSFYFFNVAKSLRSNGNIVTYIPNFKDI